jgi:hypothetical protein
MSYPNSIPEIVVKDSDSVIGHGSPTIADGAYCLLNDRAKKKTTLHMSERAEYNAM